MFKGSLRGAKEATQTFPWWMRFEGAMGKRVGHDLDKGELVHLGGVLVRSGVDQCQIANDGGAEDGVFI